MGLIRTAFTLGSLGLVGLAGWLAGSFYPAPDSLRRLVGQQAQDLTGLDFASLHRASLNWAGLAQALPADTLSQLRLQASQSAAQAGEAILIERSAPEEFAEGLEIVPVPLPASPPASAAGVATTVPTGDVIELCPRMSVSNAPKPTLRAQKALVQGVALLLDPTLEACLSSGFGPRNGRNHKGVDYHNSEGGPILAAGDGMVIEKKYRDDYGNMLLIDHGGGVYTRYAHLASFMEGIAPGGRVKAGQEIGLMGNSAAYRIPVHLHFEVLVGDYANPKASFGLEARDPFSFPQAP